MENTLQPYKTPLFSDGKLSDMLSDYDYEEFMKLTGEIWVLKKLGHPSGSSKVMELVADIHTALVDTVSPSLLAFDYFASAFEEGRGFSDELDTFFSDNLSEFFREACREYFRCCIQGNPTDLIIKQSFENIALLETSRFSPESPEVQQEAERIYEYCSEIKFISEQERVKMIEETSAYFDDELSRAYSERTDFISRAVRIYAERGTHNAG